MQQSILERHGDEDAGDRTPSSIESADVTAGTTSGMTDLPDRTPDRPVSGEISREEVAASLEKLFPRYEQMLRNLAK